MMRILIVILTIIYAASAVEILYQGRFLMNNEDWQITGNKKLEPAAHQSYNINNEITHYIMFKDIYTALIGVACKNYINK